MNCFSVFTKSGEFSLEFAIMTFCPVCYCTEVNASESCELDQCREGSGLRDLLDSNNNYIISTSS